MTTIPMMGTMPPRRSMGIVTPMSVAMCIVTASMRIMTTMTMGMLFILVMHRYRDYKYAHYEHIGKKPRPYRVGHAGEYRAVMSAAMTASRSRVTASVGVRSSPMPSLFTVGRSLSMFSRGFMSRFMNSRGSMLRGSLTMFRGYRHYRER